MLVLNLVSIESQESVSQFGMSGGCKDAHNNCSWSSHVAFCRKLSPLFLAVFIMCTILDSAFNSSIPHPHTVCYNHTMVISSYNEERWKTFLQLLGFTCSRLNIKQSIRQHCIVSPRGDCQCQFTLLLLIFVVEDQCSEPIVLDIFGIRETVAFDNCKLIY